MKMVLLISCLKKGESSNDYTQRKVLVEQYGELLKEIYDNLNGMKGVSFECDFNFTV